MSAAQQPIGYIVTLDTEHFHFEAHGRTKDEAGSVMGAMLDAHGDQCGLPDDWAAIYSDSFVTRHFAPGVGLRDGERIGH